jgi:hypothetical protein
MNPIKPMMGKPTPLMMPMRGKQSMLQPMQPMQIGSSADPAEMMAGIGMGTEPGTEPEPGADEESQAKLEAGFLPANMHCETCAHLDNAMCSKYGFPVADEDGCSNGYEAIDAVMDELSGDENGDIEGMESLENQSAPEGELPSNEEEIPEEEESAVTEETPEANKSGKKNIKGKGGMR